MTNAQQYPEDPLVGSPDEENPRAVTAGEQSHEDPWVFADLEAPHDPPANISEAIEEAKS